MPPHPHPQVFYWTHLSYLPMWLLLILHGPNFWKWLLVPGILFFLEKVVGLAVSRMAALSIVEVNLLPSKVHRGPGGPQEMQMVVGHSSWISYLVPTEKGSPSPVEETSSVQDPVQPFRSDTIGGE